MPHAEVMKDWYTVAPKYRTKKRLDQMSSEYDEQKLWALQECAKTSGFTPHAASVKDFLVSLETEGLVQQSNNYPVWSITDRGRDELAALQRT